MIPSDRKVILGEIEKKIYTAVKRINQFSGPFNAEEVAVEILDFLEKPMIMARLTESVQDTPTALPTALPILSAQDIAAIRAGARERGQGIVVESDGIKKDTPITVSAHCPGCNIAFIKRSDQPCIDMGYAARDLVAGEKVQYLTYHDTEDIVMKPPPGQEMRDQIRRYGEILVSKDLAREKGVK